MEVSCRICNGLATGLFTDSVLAKYSADYFYCPDCDYIFAGNPFWLEEAYTSPIAQCDTHLVSRSLMIAPRLAVLLYWALKEYGKGKYVDEGGGYGLLTRFMRDLGFDYYWSDLYTTNCLAKGFEADGNPPFAAITAMEVIEHSPNPLQFIRDRLTENRSETFIFSTELFPSGTPPEPRQWPYYSLNTGQHISFFSELGLTRLAQKLGMKYYRAGPLHIFTKKAISRLGLAVARSKYFFIPAAILIARTLGSKRNSDQTLLLKIARGLANRPSSQGVTLRKNQ